MSKLIEDLKNEFKNIEHKKIDINSYNSGWNDALDFAIEKIKEKQNV